MALRGKFPRVVVLVVLLFSAVSVSAAALGEFTVKMENGATENSQPVCFLMTVEKNNTWQLNDLNREFIIDIDRDSSAYFLLLQLDKSPWNNYARLSLPYESIGKQICIAISPTLEAIYVNTSTDLDNITAWEKILTNKEPLLLDDSEGTISELTLRPKHNDDTQAEMPVDVLVKLFEIASIAPATTATTGQYESTISSAESTGQVELPILPRTPYGWMITAAIAGATIFAAGIVIGSKIKDDSPDPPKKRIPVEKITLLQPQLKIEENKRAQLSVCVSPDNATDNTVTWASSNDRIAAVDSMGLVVGIHEGTAVITATARDGSKRQGECQVKVAKGGGGFILVTKVTISPRNIALEINQQAQLQVSVEPADATDCRIVWKSSNEAVASVDNAGKVVAVGPGKANIVAAAQDGSGCTGSSDVSVYEPPPEVDRHDLIMDKAYSGDERGYNSLIDGGHVKSLEIGNKTELINGIGDTPLFLIKPGKVYVVIDDCKLYPNPDYFWKMYDQGEFARRMLERCYSFIGTPSTLVKFVHHATVKRMEGYYELVYRGTIEFKT